MTTMVIFGLCEETYLKQIGLIGGAYSSGTLDGGGARGHSKQLTRMKLPCTVAVAMLVILWLKIHLSNKNGRKKETWPRQGRPAVGTVAGLDSRAKELPMLREVMMVVVTTTSSLACELEVWRGFFWP